MSFSSNKSGIGKSSDVALDSPVANDVLSYDASTKKWTNNPIPVTSVAGKAGAVTLTKSDVGLGNVDNTSDANKPLSTATQTALTAKLNSSANLSDIADTTVARNNLGLGDAAQMDVGTTAGTVAAGDDTRFIYVASGDDSNLAAALASAPAWATLVAVKVAGS